MIESFRNYLPLFGIIWSFPLQLLVNMLIVIGIQALYAIRIWKFGHRFNMGLPWLILFRPFHHQYIHLHSILYPCSGRLLHYHDNVLLSA
ncbi:hypothetical protein IW262DRAFT_1386071 [Armillaria fumosa]|nr:hypothetical protein IW262DRAFT_1386071 [Armillaria fumosa]